MFGIGYQEMFVLLVVALVIFGPSRLPELAGQLGRLVRDFRRMTADLTGEFEKTIAEVDDVKRSVKREVRSMKAEVEGVTKSVQQDLSPTPTKPATAKAATAKRAGSAPASIPAKTAATAKAAAPSVAAALPVATKADPLADVSFLDDGLPATQNGHGEPLAATATVAGANGNGAVPGEDDALARVRRRRATARYNRRV